MPQETRGRGGESFIQAELRPDVGLPLDRSAPLPPGASREEMQARLAGALSDAERENLGLEKTAAFAEDWQTVFERSEEVNSTVLDREAVLLNLESGVYYTLNPVGTAIWDLLDGERSLGKILDAVCERFDVSEPVARRDVAALASQLRREGLITERR
jgi:hypothetical protein